MRTVRPIRISDCRIKRNRILIMILGGCVFLTILLKEPVKSESSGVISLLGVNTNSPHPYVTFVFKHNNDRPLNLVAGVAFKTASGWIKSTTFEGVNTLVTNNTPLSRHETYSFTVAIPARPENWRAIVFGRQEATCLQSVHSKINRFCFNHGIDFLVNGNLGSQGSMFITFGPEMLSSTQALPQP